MLLTKLKLKNILSFRNTELELGPLNVLIGPNAAGKSNLIEAISLLQALPTDIHSAIRRGGGVRSWTWQRDAVASPTASLECVLGDWPAGSLYYDLEFSEERQGFVILKERLAGPAVSTEEKGVEEYFTRDTHRVMLIDKTWSGIDPDDSVLKKFRNPADLTPTTAVGEAFEEIRIFREFRTGLVSSARQGALPSMAKDFLVDGGDNLALVMLELDYHGVRDNIRQYLKRLYEPFEDIRVRLDGGAAQIYVREAGMLEPLSAIRLSDGTLRFLCLLAILLHPDPPPLVCIEEPEVGLHPEALEILAEVFLEASQRMQLVVTTQSEAFIDALTDSPEAVLVCERDSDHSTQFKRLSRDKLAGWLDRYSLGELWRKGEIGGSRW
jgi:predicted ATPase